MGNDTENIKILCIGVGGAGTNVINRMEDIGIPNADDSAVSVPSVAV